MYHLNLTFIASIIRSGKHIQDESMLSNYVVLGIEHGISMKNTQETKKVYLTMYNLLLETLCDSVISLRWRMLCYNNINTLMPLIAEVLDDNEFLMKKRELTAFYRYFLRSENAQNLCFNVKKK